MGKQGVHGQAFHGVVVRGSGAVQVHVIDLPGCQPRLRQCFLHGLQCTLAAGVGGGNMVGVTTGAGTEQGNGAGRLAHHEQCGGFTDVDAIAVA
ncbi:hypothetical protein D3C71_1909460 [compost metagenome]